MSNASNEKHRKTLMRLVFLQIFLLDLKNYLVPVSTTVNILLVTHREREVTSNEKVQRQSFYPASNLKTHQSPQASIYYSLSWFKG